MNSFDLNKILGALLGTCLVLVAVHIAAGAVFTPATPAKPGYIIAVKTEQPAQSSKPAAPTAQPIEAMLSTASVKQGESDVKVCEVCHNLGKGQGAKIGPDLYGVVGRPVASEPGFNYSSALKAKGGTWTFDALNVWLTDPRADVSGTLMTFAGIPSEKQRADVIAYLNSNSDKPLPLPKPAQAAPAKPASSAAASNPTSSAPASPASPAPAAPAAPAAPVGSSGTAPALPRTNAPPTGQGSPAAK